MDKIQLESTKKTPKINFDPNGDLFIGGDAIPENAIAFFTPLCQWLEDYISTPASITRFKVKMNYINTSATKYLLSMMTILEKAYTNGKDVMVNWHAESDDLDLQELGEELQQSLKLPVNVILD